MCIRDRLEIARGLMHYPKVLFLDEPTLGLDVQTRRAIWEYILKLNKDEGVTIFLTTHYLEEADSLSARVAIMDHGKILAIERPESLKSMVGNDIITVECSNPEKLKEFLLKEEWIEKIKLHGSSLSIYVENGESGIINLVKVAEDCRVKISHLTLRKPTLEDVYLHFTGKTIRDAEANAAERMKLRARRRRWRR